MLTTTDRADLIAELRTLADKLNDTLAIAEHIAGTTHDFLFADNMPEILEPHIKDDDPAEPENALLTLYNALTDLKRVVDTDPADLETQGGECYDRLLRMADLLELA